MATWEASASENVEQGRSSLTAALSTIRRAEHRSLTEFTDEDLSKGKHGQCVKGKSTLTAAPEDFHGYEKAPGSKHAHESGTADVPDARQGTKRQAIFLNSQPPPEVRQTVADCGCAVLVYENFGGPMTNTSQLTGVKRALKLGEVIWLHGVVEPRHWHNPRWVAQC